MVTHEAFTAQQTQDLPPIGPTLEEREWASFKVCIFGFTPQAQSDIEFAYNTAQGAHRYQVRKSGERFFSHPREVALILLNVGVTDHEIICAALLHDVREDAPEYLERAGRGDLDYDPLSRTLSGRVSNLVTELTQGGEYEGKKGEKLYFRALREMRSDAILIKMADRLHNLRTLYAMPPDKQRKKIRETRRMYLPVFRRVLEDYPVEDSQLLAQILQTLTFLEAASPQNITSI